MIISRTPFRISFFGGGTDYPKWYKEYGGHCVSATINKYCYVTCRDLPPFFDHRYFVRYHKQETASNVGEIEHPVVRNAINFTGLANALEIVHTGDLPARSGMGSSSSFTVGLLNCLNALEGRLSTKRELAEGAIHIEQNMCMESVGSQDQIAAAFGGLNSIRFDVSGDFGVHPIPIGKSVMDELSKNLLLCFTGFSRTASEIAETQIKRVRENTKALTRMAQICEEGLSLFGGDIDLDMLAGLLNEQWSLKKTLSSEVSNVQLDELYEVAIKNGALGGKLLGAGSGGFMLFVVPEFKRTNVVSSLNGKLFVPFRFVNQGSSIIYYNK